MPNHQFEHLPLVLREHGPAYFPQSYRGEDPTTANNKANRGGHASELRSSATAVSTSWKKQQATRVQSGLSSIEAGIPLLLNIDPSLELDDLRQQFHLEIVSEQEDGFVIVASEDVDLATFQQKLTEFVGSITGSANVARIHELMEDVTQEQRLRAILTDELFQEWHAMDDDALYVCDVSIACVGDWEVPK